MRWYLFAIFFGSALAEYGDWNNQDVPATLKSWILAVKKNSQVSMAEISRPDSKCYGENEIQEIYLFDDHDKDINEPAPAARKLNNAAGRLIFKDKKQLEATNFVHGIAEGEGKITLHWSQQHASNDSFLSGRFQNGCLTGMVRGYEYLPSDGVEHDPSFDEPVMNYVAPYENGVAVGPTWRIIYSPDGIVSGYFYKQETSPGGDGAGKNNAVDYTQTEVIFLYPDLTTGIRGQFDRKGVLVSGKLVTVTGERLWLGPDSGFVKELQFSNPSGPILKPDLSDKLKISSHPMDRDPYEAKMVDVRLSKIEKAGDGVFLEVDTPEKTIVSYFNGIRLRKNDVFTWNPFKKASVYLVETSDEEGNDVFFDIPAASANWSKYRATAGHKVNHSKKPNVAYTECEHPVHGKILCLYTLKDLPSGTELLTHYEVAMDKEGMKTMLKAALEIGHRYTGKPRKQFASEVRPYLELASKFAEKINVDSLLSF